jgi:hypothetical protein
VYELTNGQFNGSIDSINWVIGKILKCPNLILVADIKNMSSGEQDSTESFLSLLAKLHSRNFSNITSLTTLLNKADDVLGDKDESDLIENWSDMNDSLLATELLNRFTNSALSELKSTGLNCNVSFCCSLGGMFESDRPMYPLVPVNVLEPLIDLILDASVAES